jgi:hypothetical protein
MAKPVTIYELELDDLLSDPIVLLTMRSDGVCPEATRNELYALKKRLRLKHRTDKLDLSQNSEDAV